MRETRTLLPLLIVVLCVLGCGRSCCAPRVDTSGWQPGWMESPPRFDVTLEIEPMKRAPADRVKLGWKFEQGENFGYEVRNKVRIVEQAIKKGPSETETEGTIMFRPLDADQAEVRLTTHLVSGSGSPSVKTWTMGPGGKLQDADPAIQDMFQLIFPMAEEPLVPGEPAEILIAFPDAGKDVRTISQTQLGIVGFSKVEGRACAVVALDHEARILTRNKATGEMKESGSITRLKLLGYFDIEMGRYVAVSISENSVTVHGAGETRAERSATYVLRGLTGS